MRKRSSLRFALLPAVAAVVLSVGCENAVTLPTPPDQTQGYDVYFGPLDPGGRSVYLVTLDQATTTQVMLAGVVLDNPFRSVNQALTVSFGGFDGTQCTDLEAVETTPRFTAAIQRYLPAGTHCVTVADTGGRLTEPVGVILRVVAPTILQTSASPGTDVFASVITPGGRATRSVEASTPGTINVTLTSLSSNVAAGLALGIPATDGSGCQLAKVVTATPGSSPQLSVPVDAGFYCMALYDIGNFTGVQNFSVTISHP